MINVSSKNGLSTSRSVKFEEPKNEESVSMEFDTIETPKREESLEPEKKKSTKNVVKVKSKKSIR